MLDPRVLTFFCGSYINPAVLREVGLDRLYARARDVLGGAYLPRPVVAEELEGYSKPALCYIAAELSGEAPDPADLTRIVEPARAHG